jgi:hypothetical protein
MSIRNEPDAGRPSAIPPRQGGQAMIESLFVVGLLCVLIASVCAIGRLQFTALQAGGDSRLLAFSYARGGRSTPIRRGVTGTTHRAGSAQELSGALATIVRGRAGRFMQVGGDSSLSASLRRDWQAEDGGVVTAQVGVGRLSLLAGAGHATSVRAAAERVRKSESGWNGAASRSRAAGSRATSRINGIDRGWHRVKPDFDWLQPWRELLPEHTLRTAPRLESPD